MSSTRDGLVDPRVAKALSHPLRAHVLAILNERVGRTTTRCRRSSASRSATSATTSRRSSSSSASSSFSTTPRRGAVEHFYRAIERPYFSERDWSRLPRSLRQAISDVGLQLIWDDVADAIEGGTFEARVDRHLSRYPLVLDQRGWEELGELLTGLFDPDRARSRQRKAPRVWRRAASRA